MIGRPVAVKTIKLSEQGTGLTRSELIARFQTEARAAGLLTHHNIVVVYDAGEEDGLFYITMELVEGKSVQALLDAGADPSVRDPKGRKAIDLVEPLEEMMNDFERLLEQR